MTSHPILCASFNQDNTGFAISTKDGFRVFDSSTGRLCYERGKNIVFPYLAACNIAQIPNQFRSSQESRHHTNSTKEKKNEGAAAIIHQAMHPLALRRRQLLRFAHLLLPPPFYKILPFEPFSIAVTSLTCALTRPSLSPRRLCLFNTTTGAALRELNFLTSILAVRLNRKRLVVVLQEKTYIYDANTLEILDTIQTAPNVKGLCAFSPNLEGCFLALPASTTKGSVLVYNVLELRLHCEVEELSF